MAITKITRFNWEHCNCFRVYWYPPKSLMIFMGDDLGLCSRPHDLITDLMTASRYFKTALQHPKTERYSVWSFTPLSPVTILMYYKQRDEEHRKDQLEEENMDKIKLTTTSRKHLGKDRPLPPLPNQHRQPLEPKNHWSHYYELDKELPYL